MSIVSIGCNALPAVFKDDRLPMKTPRVPCILRTEAVKAHMARANISRQQLAKALGVSTRAIGFWLKRDPTRRPTFGHVEAIATLIGVDPDEIAEIDLDATDDIVSAGGPPLRGLYFDVFLKPLAIDLWPEVIHYLRHIQPRMVPLAGTVRRFKHDGSRRNVYAGIRITPSQRGQVQRFEFHYNFGSVLRIGYGTVTLTPDGSLSLFPVWGSYKGTSTLAADGTFTCYTLFGDSPCTFLVRSDQPFELDVQVAEEYSILDRLEGLCFRPAPHHIGEASRNRS